MTLEDEIQKLIDDAVKRNPLVLGTSVGERSRRADVSRAEEFDLLLDLFGGLREAMLRLAREIDEPGAT